MNFRAASSASSSTFLSSHLSSSSSPSQLYEDENEPGSNVSVDRASLSKGHLARTESYPHGAPNNDHFPFYPPILENTASSYRTIHFANHPPTSSSSASLTTLQTSTFSSSSSPFDDSLVPSFPPALDPTFSRQGSDEFFGRGLDYDTEESPFDSGDQKCSSTDDDEEPATRSFDFAQQLSIARTNSTVSTVYNGFDEETTRGLLFSPPDDDDTIEQTEMKQNKNVNPLETQPYQPNTLSFADRSASATTINPAVSRVPSIASTLSPHSTLSNASNISASALPSPALSIASTSQSAQLTRTVSSPSNSFASRSPAMSNPLPARPPALLTHPSAHTLHHASSLQHSISSSFLSATHESAGVDSTFQDMSLVDADSDELPPPSHLVLTLRRQNAMISDEDQTSPLPDGVPMFPIRAASYSSSSSSTSANLRSVSNSSHSTAALDSTWTSSYSASSSPSFASGAISAAAATPRSAASAPSSSSISSSSSVSSSSSSSTGSSSSSTPPSSLQRRGSLSRSASRTNS